jgi:High potential iron-sulfur protein
VSTSADYSEPSKINKIGATKFSKVRFLHEMYADAYNQLIFIINCADRSRKIPRDFFNRTITMQSKISRRAVVKGGLIAGALVPALSMLANTTTAAGFPPLDPNDPTAKALGYVTDATKVDASANPTYKPTQKCSNCAQYQGKASDASAGCNIFAGHSVPQGGWCKVWAQKP